MRGLDARRAAEERREVPRIVAPQDRDERAAAGGQGPDGLIGDLPARGGARVDEGGLEGPAPDALLAGVVLAEPVDIGALDDGGVELVEAALLVDAGGPTGGQSTDLVLVGVNARSMDDLLKDKVKLGGDIAASAGPVGRNSQASTTELANAEFLTYSRSQGLFAGVDLTGDEVHQNSEDTRAYYGKDIPYRTILSGEVPTPAGARHFEATVNEMFRRGRADKAAR